jgi:hypothetical protein
MRTLGLMGAVSGLAFAAIGCGEPFQVGTGATGSATTTTTTSGGGAGGEGGVAAGSGGGGGQGGGGAACDPADPAGCEPGQYCVASTGACAPCAVIGDALQFGAAQALDLQGLEGPAPYPSFPRSRLNGGVEELVFVVQGASGGAGDTDIALSTRSAGSWSPGEYFPGEVVNSSSTEWAPLYLPEGTEISGVPISADLLVFSAFVNPRRQIFAASPTSPSRTQLPGVNDSSDDTYSLALAYEAAPPRVWYMRKFGVAFLPTLVTQIPGGSYDVVSEILLPDGVCPVDVEATADLAPWVTPRGEHLLFHADWPASCGGPGVRRGFFVEVNPADGLPVSEARELEIAGLPAAADERTPALKGDQC